MGALHFRNIKAVRKKRDGIPYEDCVFVPLGFPNQAGKQAQQGEEQESNAKVAWGHSREMGHQYHFEAGRKENPFWDVNQKSQEKQNLTGTLRLPFSGGNKKGPVPRTGPSEFTKGQV
jgi:hypothetical protein